jgi:hypothetical protein
MALDVTHICPKCGAQIAVRTTGSNVSFANKKLAKRVATHNDSNCTIFTFGQTKPPQ